MSPIDAQAIKHWDGYSVARNEMFARTHNPVTPWTVAGADVKRLARLNLIKDQLSLLHYCDKDAAALLVNSQIVFQYDETYIRNRMISV